MIPGVNIISRNSSIANINRSEGSGSTLSPSVVVIGGQSPLRKSLAPNKHLDWVKVDLNAAKIVAVQGYKCTKT